MILNIVSNFYFGLNSGDHIIFWRPPEIEVIQALFIRESETRQKPKPHTVYKVEVHAAVRKWTVWKRYSEFTKLHEQLCAVYPHHPPPFSLPKKSLFPSTFGYQQNIEDCKHGLKII
ncbi:unnamed protein product [Cunninghamella echinulata]